MPEHMSKTRDKRRRTDLDAFILALIDSGISTPYEFQKLASLSQGATIPARTAQACRTGDGAGLMATLGLRRPYIPLLLDGRDILKDGPSDRGLHQLYRYFMARNVELSEKTLEKALQAGDCMVIMDGIDELQDRIVREFGQLTADLQMRYPLNTFIASARPGQIEYVPPFDRFDKFRLEWNLERIQLIARKYWTLAGQGRDTFQEYLGHVLVDAEPLLNPFLVQLIARSAAQRADSGKRLEMRDAIGTVIQQSVHWVGTRIPRDLTLAAIKAICAAMSGSDQTRLVIDGQSIAGLLKTKLNFSTEQTLEILTGIRGAGLIIERRPGEYELAHDLIAAYFRDAEPGGVPL
jgi:hypothetical protein